MSVALVAVLSFSSAAMAADSDGDGLDDSIENMYGWNPYDANSPGEDDYDGDGIIDVTEYYSFTNMYDADDPVDAGDTDDDQDTLAKGLEVYLMGTDPDKADSDCDGVDDNLDANPVDGVCEIPEPNPGVDLTDDIRTSGGDSEDQSLAPTVPLQLYYAVEYNDEQTYSTENIDPDSDFMIWSLSDNTFASINENTGIFEFYNGTPEGTVVTVTATHIDNGDITDTMLITSTMGIPDVNGILNDDIRTDIGDSDDQTIAAEVPLQLYYAVDYTDGETYSTENVAPDSDVMSWSLSDYSDASIDADTGVFEFKPGTLAGTQVTVTATGNENSEITDTIEVFAKDELTTGLANLCDVYTEPVKVRITDNCSTCQAWYTNIDLTCVGGEATVLVVSGRPAGGSTQSQAFSRAYDIGGTLIAEEMGSVSISGGSARLDLVETNINEAMGNRAAIWAEDGQLMCHARFNYDSNPQFSGCTVTNEVAPSDR